VKRGADDPDAVTSARLAGRKEAAVVMEIRASTYVEAIRNKPAARAPGCGGAEVGDGESFMGPCI